MLLTRRWIFLYSQLCLHQDIVCEDPNDCRTRSSIRWANLSEGFGRGPPSGFGNVAGICESLSWSYAYTTVMTTLDRLYKKGSLTHQSGSCLYLCSRLSAEELDRALTAYVMSTLLDTDPASVTPVLACIVWTGQRS